jgi:hypothetical protein
VENATPAVALSALQAFATMSLRQYEDEMEAAHRVVPSRSTLERIVKRVGGEVRDQLAIIEPVLRARERLAEDVCSISVGIDRTTIPMVERLPSLPDRWHRKQARRPPPPTTGVMCRMAYIATVAMNDRKGRTVETKRVSATADEGPVEMMERLGAELAHVLCQRPETPIVIVQDGAPELWNLVETWFEDLAIPITMKLIDRYHLDEYSRSSPRRSNRSWKRECGCSSSGVTHWIGVIRPFDGCASKSKRVCMSQSRRSVEDMPATSDVRRADSSMKMIVPLEIAFRDHLLMAA